MTSALPGDRQPDAKKGMSRRSALTAAAWTTPAIVVASAAPAYAASLPSVPPMVVVTVARTIIAADTCQYVYTFNNAGDATTAFSHTDAFTRVSADGRIETATPDSTADWAVSGGDGDTMQTFTITKVDGVLPPGETTHTMVYVATALSVPDMPGSGYVADLTITANPTPGTGTATMSGFESYFDGI